MIVIQCVCVLWLMQWEMQYYYYYYLMCLSNAIHVIQYNVCINSTMCDILFNILLMIQMILFCLLQLMTCDILYSILMILIQCNANVAVCVCSIFCVWQLTVYDIINVSINVCVCLTTVTILLIYLCIQCKYNVYSIILM